MSLPCSANPGVRSCAYDRRQSQPTKRPDGAAARKRAIYLRYNDRLSLGQMREVVHALYGQGVRISNEHALPQPEQTPCKSQQKSTIITTESNFVELAVSQTTFNPLYLRTW